MCVAKTKPAGASCDYRLLKVLQYHDELLLRSVSLIPGPQDFILTKIEDILDDG